MLENFDNFSIVNRDYKYTGLSEQIQRGRNRFLDNKLGPLPQSGKGITHMKQQEHYYRDGRNDVITGVSKGIKDAVHDLIILETRVCTNDVWIGTLIKKIVSSTNELINVSWCYASDDAYKYGITTEDYDQLVSSQTCRELFIAVDRFKYTKS